jgi:hypothetical protein
LPARRHLRPTDIALLKTMQDVLGRLHDLEVLAERVRQMLAVSPPDLTLWRQLGSLVHMLEDDCRQWHARYMHDRDRMSAAQPDTTRHPSRREVATVR